MERVYEFLKETAPTYFLATIDGDKPRVRPFGTIDLFEGRLYIQTGKGKDVFKQIEANPNVEICAAAGPDWLRIEAQLVADDRIEPKKHMLDAYPELRALYDENDENTIVLYLKNATATFASLAGKEGWTISF